MKFHKVYPLIFILFSTLCYADIEPLGTTGLVPLGDANIGKAVGVTLVSGGGCVAGSTVLGVDTGPRDTPLFKTQIYLMQHTAIASCDVSTITVDFVDAGDAIGVRTAVYADSGSDTPTGAKIQDSAQVITSAGDGESESVVTTLDAAVSMTSGTKYWLAIWTSENTSAVADNENIDADYCINGYQAGDSYYETNDFPSISSFTGYTHCMDVVGKVAP